MFELYKQLKDSGFPQGGTGQYMRHPDTDERVYVPQPSEIYAQFILDPEGWKKVTDALAKVWVETKR